MQLKDKVVVITGASKGLGRAIAEALAKENTKLILSSHPPGELDAVAKSIGATSIAADVTNEDQITKLAAAAVKKFKKIDIWINNAGVWLPHAPIEQVNSKRAHEMMEVNLFGTIYGSKAALIQMKKQQSGTIINILSTSALEGRAGSALYCASKYAANGFTKSLRLEAGPENILTIAIYPGGMRTHLFDEKKPVEYDKFLNPALVANKIIDNLKNDNPKEELIIRRN